MASGDRVAVPGTQPRVPEGDDVGELDPTTLLEVTVLVRPRQSLAKLEARLDQASVSGQPIMSRQEFAASYGAEPADLVNVEAFVRDYGLRVVESSQARRSITVRGTAAAFGEAFGIRIRRYRDATGRTFSAPNGAISVPSELDGVVQGVFGLDDRPAARER